MEATIIDPGPPPPAQPILRVMLGQLVLSVMLVFLQGAILALKQRYGELAKKSGDTV